MSIADLAFEEPVVLLVVVFLTIIIGRNKESASTLVRLCYGSEAIILL